MLGRFLKQPAARQLRAASWRKTFSSASGAKSLVVAEHADGAMAAATLHAIGAANQLGGEVPRPISSPRHAQVIRWRRRFPCSWLGPLRSAMASPQNWLTSTAFTL
jgi:hypothetical protein